MRYRDRLDAGRHLVAGLRSVDFGSSGATPVVLGVARGGIAVAAPIAASFGVPLGVVVARKLGAPGNPELAIGAVGMGGDAYVDDGLARRLGVSAEYLATEIAEQRRQVSERATLYGRAADPDRWRGCDVAVVDDGVATGATLIAGLRSVRSAGPTRLICAVPVGPAETLERLSSEADVVVCPQRPRWFQAVGEWYHDFTQTRDEEVVALLRGAEGESPVV